MGQPTLSWKERHGVVLFLAIVTSLFLPGIQAFIESCRYDSKELSQSPDSNSAIPKNGKVEIKKKRPCNHSLKTKSTKTDDS